MDLHKIIYDTTREVFNLDDKLSIATLIIFCQKIGSIKFAELLYATNHEKFISDLTAEYKHYDVDFTVNLKNTNVKSAFYKTIEKVKTDCDSNGYLKALHEQDPYALVIAGIVNHQFDKLKFTKMKANISRQLTFNF